MATSTAAPNTAKPLIVLTAGGTGGHVFPAESLAAELQARGYRLAFITDARGKGYSGVLGSLDTHHVTAAQMLGRGLLGKIAGALRLLRGTFEARAILRRLSPAVVVGFGGYASVPAVAAAGQLGIPTLLHEQNAVLGRANRLFSAKATRIATSFDQVRFLPAATTDAPQQVIKTGMPVRAAIRAAAETPYPSLGGDAPLEVLILGGSQGARVLSDVLPAAFKALPAALQARLRISQQARPEDLERVRASYADSGLSVDVQSFFEDVPARLARAALVIGRAGSSTVAECAVIGRPALFVPLPSAADDHQTANAQAMEASGGAWMIPQSRFSAETVADQLAGLLSQPATLEAAAAAAKAFALPDAASRLADAVETLLRQETRP